MPANVLAVRPLTWDEIIEEDDDDENWAVPARASSERSRSGDGNDNDDIKGKQVTQGGEKGTEKVMGTKDGKWTVKGTTAKCILRSASLQKCLRGCGVKT